MQPTGLSHHIDATFFISAPETTKFPANSLINREFGIESGSQLTASTTTIRVILIAREG